MSRLLCQSIVRGKLTEADYRKAVEIDLRGLGLFEWQAKVRICHTMGNERQISEGILAFTHCGAYMTTFYLFIKALYLVQACAQFIILNR